MAATTYLSHILAHFAALGAVVNDALAADGQAELKDWFAGTPAGTLRTANCPYAFYDLVDRELVDLPVQALGAGDFELVVLLTVVIDGSSPSEVLDKLSWYAPQITAAIEGEPFEYDLMATEILPGEQAGPQGKVRFFGIPFVVRGERRWGEVL